MQFSSIPFITENHFIEGEKAGINWRTQKLLKEKIKVFEKKMSQ